jgi:aspartyl aminopeptidase
VTATATDLLEFVDRGVSPFHVVAEMSRRLDAAGFAALDEREPWALAAADRRYVIREGSIIAFVVGEQAPSDSGFRLIGAHTDSPTFRVRPAPDAVRAELRTIGVEPYGGALRHTWLDRDLTLAGRVVAHGADGALTEHLVHLPGAWLRIPSLAIHLDRELNSQGLKLDPQRHIVPVWGPANGPDLIAAVAEHAGMNGAEILGWDLVLADTQPAALGGADDAFVFAPRLDNLASCHAALHALCTVERADATAVIVANDHEEVGSASAEGASGSFLDDVLGRIAGTVTDDAQGYARARARSLLVSADMAHAVHPNYADRHETGHQPRLGGGPVIKHNANQAYASDAASVAWFRARAAEAGVAVQHFVTRADLPCGSTIGPLTATRLGIPTVDVGNPMLSMHSIREQAAAADVAPMARAMAAHLQAPVPA